MKFRFHRGTLKDSLKTTSTIQSADEIITIIKAYLPLPVKKVTLGDYYEDYREGSWGHTWIVEADGKPVGMVDAEAALLFTSPLQVFAQIMGLTASQAADRAKQMHKILTDSP